MKNIFLSLSLLAATLGQAQKVSNHLNFTKGQKLEVVTNMTISAESMMGPSSGTVSLADTYIVNDATANAYTLTKLPKQVKLDFTVGSQQIKVDSDNPKDMNSMLADPVKEIMSQKPEFTIDATGKITAVKKDENKKDDDAQGGGMMGMMLPGMDLNGAVPQVGNPSFFQVLPAREVGTGDTWTDSTDVEGNKNVTNYTVKEITDKEIILDFKGEGKTVSTREAMGMKVNVNASTRATGSIVIDKATGIVKQKTSTATTETSMNLSGQEVNSTAKTTMVTNVKPS